MWKVSKYGVFSGPNRGKYGPEKNAYLDTFHTVLEFKNRNLNGAHSIKLPSQYIFLYLQVRSSHIWSNILACKVHLKTFKMHSNIQDTQKTFGHLSTQRTLDTLVFGESWKDTQVHEALGKLGHSRHFI